MKIQLPVAMEPSPLGSLSDDLLQRMYHRMVLIRRFEKRVNELFLQGIMPGTIHLSHGQEATVVGATSALRNDDWINLTHRGHGQALAKGVPAKSLMAELFGKVTGCCRGKGGSLHIGDVSYGALPAIAIVGAASPIMTGMAFAYKYKQTGHVACNIFGDGAVNKGDWHEAMNLAAVWNLPIVFLCENNLFGVSTHISDVTLNERLAERAAAYRMRSATVFGNDPVAVYRAVGEAVGLARAGDGPTMVEALTYRQGGHKRDDPATYRDQGEVTSWLEADPVPAFRSRLLEEKRVSEERLADLETQVEQEIEEAVRFAMESEDPPTASALEDVYAD